MYWSENKFICSSLIVLVVLSLVAAYWFFEGEGSALGVKPDYTEKNAVVDERDALVVSDLKIVHPVDSRGGEIAGRDAVGALKRDQYADALYEVEGYEEKSELLYEWFQEAPEEVVDWLIFNDMDDRYFYQTVALYLHGLAEKNPVLAAEKIRLLPSGFDTQNIAMEYLDNYMVTNRDDALKWVVDFPDKKTGDVLKDRAMGYLAMHSLGKFIAFVESAKETIEEDSIINYAIFAGQNIEVDADSGERIKQLRNLLDEPSIKAVSAGLVRGFVETLVSDGHQADVNYWLDELPTGEVKDQAIMGYISVNDDLDQSLKAMVSLSDNNHMLSSAKNIMLKHLQEVADPDKKNTSINDFSKKIHSSIYLSLVDKQKLQKLFEVQ